MTPTTVEWFFEAVRVIVVGGWPWMATRKWSYAAAEDGGAGCSGLRRGHAGCSKPVLGLRRCCCCSQPPDSWLQPQSCLEDRRYHLCCCQCQCRGRTRHFLSRVCGFWPCGFCQGTECIPWIPETQKKKSKSVLKAIFRLIVKNKNAKPEVCYCRAV